MKRLLCSSTFGLALLLSVSALGQTAPPVLNAPPTAPPPAPVQAAPAPEVPLTLGQTYLVETVRGTTFAGTLVSMSLSSLEFDARDLGHITLQREQIQQLSLADSPGVVAAPTAPAVGLKTNQYYDIGNGNRLFFAPTARGLRKGEGTVQDVDVYLLGVNYGLTDNFSIGGYLSIIPGVELTNQLLVLTPKLSFPVNDKLHVGAGVLYVRVPDGNNGGTTGGIGYGAITYGGADDNFTVGLGYGFDEDNVNSSPIIQIGGQTRVSRRISLVSENYIAASSGGGAAGLYGLKINWRHTSLGLGGLYFYTFGHYEDSSYTYYDPNTGQYVTVPQKQYQPSYGFSTYVIPVYCDFTFRFGKGLKQK